MADTNWAWADLTNSQLQHVAEAENTLGADYLIVFQPDKPVSNPVEGSLPGVLQIASLTPSQLECLQGLENRLQAVVVAYHKGEQ